MKTLERLNARHLVAVVTSYRDALRSHQEAINRLNVYPVPDGDTGTNMALTLESVVLELAESGAEDMAGVCRALSHGSLMGARGNSGVILSQILRGLAEAFKSQPEVDGPILADGLRRARDGAYSAVMRPVEGTILTVAGAAADAASDKPDSSLLELLDAAKAAADEALARTPELLAVLKQAGVVDAGGAGLVLLLDALLLVVAGRPLPQPAAGVTEPAANVAGVAASAAGVAALAEPSAPLHDEVGDLRYEVMYFLEAPDETVAAFRDVWAGIGDSIVVVGGDGLWNCHIHTDDIGAAVEAALDCGRPRQIRVTDLFEQVEEERWVREAAIAPAEPLNLEPVDCAVVAVATGEGIRRIFHSLGVQQVVAGGQSMNPSIAQLLAAIEAAPAPQVVILPNNKNIIPAAEQAADIATKEVRVVPTRGIAEGFAALLSYDPAATAEDNAGNMNTAAAHVTSGEITRAVRPSVTDAGLIAEGDYLGLTRHGIEVVSPTLAQAACDLLAKLVTDEHEIVTIIEGDGSTKADTRRITGWLEEHRPGIGPEIHHGGQPLYPYLFSIE